MCHRCQFRWRTSKSSGTFWDPGGKLKRILKLCWLVSWRRNLPAETLQQNLLNILGRKKLQQCQFDIMLPGRKYNTWNILANQTMNWLFLIFLNIGRQWIGWRGKKSKQSVLRRFLAHFHRSHFCATQIFTHLHATNSDFPAHNLLPMHLPK